jgi:enoyl-CoA hydratase
MKNLVLREDRDGICWLTLNRPDKLNALNVDLFVDLRTYVDELEKQFDTIGCVVLKGSGRCFSAGHDLKDIGTGETPPHPNYQAETIEHLANLPQTVITAIHSHCYTGALELALAGDIIVAAASAKFADTHAKWALTPAWGMSQRLPRRIGLPKAKEMMLTARTYSAEEAVNIGLANMCVPDDRLDEEVQSLVSQILANSWFSNRANKKLLEKTDGMSLAEGLKYEIEKSEGRGPDMQERIRTFGKKK